MFPSRKAIQYLKSNQSHSRFICCMCFNFSVDLLQCSGPCSKFMCIQCIDRFHSNRYNCSYCSNGQSYSWKQLKQQGVEFLCPYTLNEHVPLRNFKDFQDHCFTCPEMSQLDRFLANCIKNYQCNKGHTLLFLSIDIASRVFTRRNCFNALTRSECTLCKDVTLTRSYCQECSTVEGKQVLYCIRCRNVPVTKKRCPIGHELRRKTYRSLGSICDYCGYADKFAEGLSHTDSTCNFDICSTCFDKLPEENHLQPLANEQNVGKVKVFNDKQEKAEMEIEHNQQEQSSDSSDEEIEEQGEQKQQKIDEQIEQ